MQIQERSSSNQIQEKHRTSDGDRVRYKGRRLTLHNSDGSKNINSLSKQMNNTIDDKFLSQRKVMERNKELRISNYGQNRSRDRNNPGNYDNFPERVTNITNITNITNNNINIDEMTTNSRLSSLQEKNINAKLLNDFESIRSINKPGNRDYPRNSSKSKEPSRYSSRMPSRESSRNKIENQNLEAEIVDIDRELIAGNKIDFKCSDLVIDKQLMVDCDCYLSNQGSYFSGYKISVLDEFIKIASEERQKFIVALYKMDQCINGAKAIIKAKNSQEKDLTEVKDPQLYGKSGQRHLADEFGH